MNGGQKSRLGKLKHLRTLFHTNSLRRLRGAFFALAPRNIAACKWKSRAAAPSPLWQQPVLGALRGVYSTKLEHLRALFHTNSLRRLREAFFALAPRNIAAYKWKSRAAAPSPRGQQPVLGALRGVYSTVTDFARLRGLSISHPLSSAT